ncbi:MAG: hypothetical protein FD143_3660 [Ignavibacteria bacterium]|nr:MAG: hypothetical protein FD143_3660 [Ignavibacteria bacterium]
MGVLAPVELDGVVGAAAPDVFLDSTPATTTIVLLVVELLPVCGAAGSSGGRVSVVSGEIVSSSGTLLPNSTSVVGTEVEGGISGVAPGAGGMGVVCVVEIS